VNGKVRTLVRRSGFLLVVAVSLAAPADSTIAADVQFRRDVLPILSENCFACHGFDQKARKADLRLDERAGAVMELPSGERAIVPKNAEKSELIRRIHADPDEQMPPPKSGKKLTAAQKEILKRWIESGAEYSKHWSFEPPRPTAPPKIDAAAHPIDAFVRKTLADKKLSPSPPAELETILRRVSLDLIGLPPAPAEVDAFLEASNRNPELAYAELVDRLLANPQYGERWGRWWLDQARYGDSHGYSIDGPREIWKFRDWVVDALNADMPFDRFTIEQLAGDLLPNATVEQKIATGFHRNTQINMEGGVDPEQFRIESVFDRTATTGTVWLGLSVGCAQCHDHKFDPVLQKEYYQLFAFFNDQDEPTMRVYDPNFNVDATKAELAEAKAKLEALLKEKAGELAAWEKNLKPAVKKSLDAFARKQLKTPAAKRNFDQKRHIYAAGIGAMEETFQALNERYNRADKALKAGPTTMILAERKTPRKTTVLIKGDFTRPADAVEPGTPGVLHSPPKKNGRLNRLDLARWLVSKENPLTARVIVNRIWQQYFGKGLVESENDFGTQGKPPTHPELLDWLALELQRNSWNLKAIHRLIVTSDTYRQSSKARKDYNEKDPTNEWLGRQQRLRLEAELVRDAALSASGRLALKIGGPPVFPPIPDGALSLGQVKRDWKTSKGADRYRRALYTFIYRATPPPGLNVFDAPDGFLACTRRIRSNTPLQALTLLNDAGFVEFAESLTKIIEQEGVEAAFRRCTSRHPTSEEAAVLKELPPPAAARVLLNLDETITRE
jgi:hypothetical protein